MFFIKKSWLLNLAIILALPSVGLLVQGFGWFYISIALSIRWIFECSILSIKLLSNNDYIKRSQAIGKMLWVFHAFLILDCFLLAFNLTYGGGIIADLLFIMSSIIALSFYLVSSYYIAFNLEKEEPGLSRIFSYFISIILYPIGIITIHPTLTDRRCAEK